MSDMKELTQFSNAVVRAQSAPWHRGVEFMLMDIGGDQPLAVQNITVRTVGAGERVDPAFTLNIDDAQTLMDDLWRAGLRPTEGAGSAGSLAATERHLEDMRRLVFDKGGN